MAMSNQLFIKTNKEPLLKKYINKHLMILEDQVNIEHVLAVEQKHMDVFNFRPVNRLPILVTMRDDVAHKTAGHGDWPTFTFDHIWNDYAAMLLNELQPVYESVRIKDDKVFTIRPNLSQIFVPSLFGAEASFSLINEDSMPSIHKPPTKEQLIDVMEQGVDFKNHWTIVRYCEIINVWRELLSAYPKLSKVARFSLPDLQGPFNLYFLLRGADAYMDLFDDTEFTHCMMGFITDRLIDITNYLADYIGSSKQGYYWNYSYPGIIRNVDDNAVLISKEQYNEFVHPYNLKLSRECGGGIHHYCGKGDHIIDDIMSIRSIHGLNFGNPEQQDWDMVYEKALKYKVVLLWDHKIPAKLFNQMTYGIIMRFIVPTIEQARQELEEYKID